MNNYWLDYGLMILEKELILVKMDIDTQSWFNKMPSNIPICFTEANQITKLEDYGIKVGFAHHLRMNKFGIEGVLKMPRKYHRYKFYVYYNTKYHQKEHFHVILNKNNNIYN